MDASPRAVAPLHPLHLILVVGAFPLFLSALLADAAYANSYEIQWTNFASWLVVGALVFSGVALAWALLSLLRPQSRSVAHGCYVGLLALAFVLGFVNALVHAMDAWQKMPQALLLSALSVLALAGALWFAFGGTLRRREVLA